MGAAAFTAKYGGRSNAFGKCVAKTATRNGFAQRRARSNALSRPGRGASGAPPLPYTSEVMALRTMAPAFLRKRDDDKAFERLYERHVRDVYRYAAAMLGATADAEDVTQTTFLNAYRAFKQGTRPEKPQSWLIAIAHNVCRQRFRQAQRRPHEVEFDERVGEASRGRDRRADRGGPSPRALAAPAEPARRAGHARARRLLVRRDRRRARHQRLGARDGAVPRAPRAARATRRAAHVPGGSVCDQQAARRPGVARRAARSEGASARVRRVQQPGTEPAGAAARAEDARARPAAVDDLALDRAARARRPRQARPAPAA